MSSGIPICCGKCSICKLSEPKVTTCAITKEVTNYYTYYRLATKWSIATNKVNEQDMVRDLKVRAVNGLLGLDILQELSNIMSEMTSLELGKMANLISKIKNDLDHIEVKEIQPEEQANEK